MLGYPVAMTLGGLSLGFAIVGHLAGFLDLGLLGALPRRIYGVMGNETLLAIPLFVFMGVMLERSRIAEDLLESMGRLFGSLRGGLGISVAIVGTLLAASKGVVGATTVTLGLIMLPTMLRHGYDPRLAAGTVAATATLAQVFPPAIVLVLLGDQISNSYQAAQLAQGNFAPSSVSVADMFAGAIVPGFILVGLYLVYLVADRDPAPASRAADPARSGGAERSRHDPQAGRGADCAAGADPGRARLDPRRAGDADGSSLGRCLRRHAACRAPRRRAQPGRSISAFWRCLPCCRCAAPAPQS